MITIICVFNKIVVPSLFVCEHNKHDVNSCTTVFFIVVVRLRVFCFKELKHLSRIFAQQLNLKQFLSLLLPKASFLPHSMA